MKHILYSDQVRDILECDVRADVTTLVELLIKWSPYGEEVLEEVYEPNNYYPDDPDYEPFEYWMLDPSLGKDLADHGEVVWTCISHAIWARQTSGLSLYIDAVMEQIAQERLERMK